MRGYLKLVEVARRQLCGSPLGPCALFQVKLSQRFTTRFSVTAGKVVLPLGNEA